MKVAYSPPTKNLKDSENFSTLNMLYPNSFSKKLYKDLHKYEMYKNQKSFELFSNLSLLN